MFIFTNGITERLPSHKLDQPQRQKKEDTFQWMAKGLYLSTVWCCAVVFLRLLYTKQVEF